jgi:putative transposase
MPGSYRIFSGTNYAYFATCTIVEWLPVFVWRPYFNLIIESLKHLRTHKGVQLNAYVIMPTHLHLILWPNPGINLSDVLRDFKRYTSRAISTQLEADHRHHFLRIMAAAKPTGKGRETARYRVWQEGSHPEAIYSETFFRQKLEYTHNNPVEQGFVALPEHWLYSSARNYVLGDHSIIEVDLLPL